MNFLRKIVNSTYRNHKPLSEEEYEKNRKKFIFEGMSSNPIAGLTGGAFLAGFAKYLGIGEALSGLLLNMPNMTNLLQLFAPFLYEKKEYRKHVMATLATMSRVLLAIMIFIPFVFQSTTARVIAIFTIMILSYACLQLSNPGCQNWLMSLVPIDIRGNYLGTRDSCILAFTTVVTLVYGVVLDVKREANDELGGFVLVYIAVGVLLLINTFMLHSIREPKAKIRFMKLVDSDEKVPAGINFKQLLVVPLLNEQFRKALMYNLRWNASVMLCLPYFSIYQVVNLKLSYTFIMGCGILQSLTNVFASKFWGKIADKKGWGIVGMVCIGLTALSHICWFFIVGDIKYVMVPINCILGGFTWAGINLVNFNIPFLYSPEKAKTVYISFYNVVGGVVCLITTLVASVFVALMQNVELPMFLGTHISASQILFIVSGVLLLNTAWYFNRKFRLSIE